MVATGGALYTEKTEGGVSATVSCSALTRLPHFASLKQARVGSSTVRGLTENRIPKNPGRPKHF